MKILEINKFYNSKRGADKHFLDVIALLKEGGHEVADFSMIQDDNEYSQWEDYFLSPVGYNNSFSIWERIKGAGRMFYSFEAHRKINTVLDEFRPDIVHVHNLYHQMSPTILFEIKKRNIPIVMTVHDFKLVNPNHSLRLAGQAYRRCANGKYYQCILDRCVKNSYALSFLAAAEMYWHSWLGTYSKNIDYYIAPSEFTKKILTEWGMDKDKIITLPHFAPTLKGKTAGGHSFAVADSFALYAGNISREKGADTLIGIFTQQKGMKLYLAGEVEKGFEIPAHANIVYLGFLNTDKLAEYIRKSKCVISGSELPETFGLIALEAITAGKPFLGYDVGAYGEVIQHGKSGLIAQNKQQLAEFIDTIAKGEIVFSEQEIKMQAQKYNAHDYCEKIALIFSNAINLKK